MNILHIYDDYGPVLGGGSAPTVVLNLSRHMVRLGAEVSIIERKNREEDCYIEHIDGIKFIRIEAKKRVPCPLIALNENPILGPFRFILDCIEFAVKVNKYLNGKEDNFDIIHIHFPFATSVLVILNRKLRRKMVYTAHVGEEKIRFKLDSGKEIPLPLRLFSPDLFLMKRVRKSVVLNETLRLKLVSTGKINAENIMVVHNGIDTNAVNPYIDIKDIRGKYELKCRVSILFSGSITPRKGVEYIVKAANIIVNESNYTNVLFLLVGDPSYDTGYTEKVSKLIKDYELEKYVKLAGFVPYDDLRKLYVACTIFVLPSKEEGHGLVLTEAMASGKPLIGTNVGGIPVQIRDGWNGFLVEPANEKQLAEKIKYLIDHPEKREEMGRNSRKLAEEVFDWRTIAERYLEVYEEVAR